MGSSAVCGEPLILALETSCDETAVAVVRGTSEVLASEISSQIAVHQPYGGVVPELASRNHMVRVRPLIEAALNSAGVALSAIDGFAATAGPGLASSLLVGNTVAKALAVSGNKPYFAINHIEGHLLSPFMGREEGVRRCVGLVVSGGHTLLVHVAGAGDYRLLGQTCDDAAGEAFDKVGKMLGLPYPGGPEIDRLAKSGNPAAFAFPRSMLHSGDFTFSFSGLKTAVLYQLPKLDGAWRDRLGDLCASFQEAVVDILAAKLLAAARACGERCVTASGGVSCNSRLRERLIQICQAENLELLLAAPQLATDNAAMIGYVAAIRWREDKPSAVEGDVNPNLALGAAPAGPGRVGIQK